MRIRWRFLRWIRTKLGIFTVVSGDRPQGGAFETAVASLSQIDNPVNGSVLTLQDVVSELGRLQLHDGTRPFQDWCQPGFILRQAHLNTLCLCLARWKESADNVEASIASEREDALFIRSFFRQDIAASAGKPGIHNQRTGIVFQHYLKLWEPEEHRVIRTGTKGFIQ